MPFAHLQPAWVDRGKAFPRAPAWRGCTPPKGRTPFLWLQTKAAVALDAERHAAMEALSDRHDELLRLEAELRAAARRARQRREASGRLAREAARRAEATADAVASRGTAIAVRWRHHVGSVGDDRGVCGIFRHLSICRERWGWPWGVWHFQASIHLSGALGMAVGCVA
jgi:hypothetical protein